MAKVMCVWELGGNLGHLACLRRFAVMALEQGHEVYMVLRELQNGPKVLGDLPVHYLQAPFKHGGGVANTQRLLCYSQLIRQYCFTDAEELRVYASAWRELFSAVSPDLVIYDHSPTALIASWGLGFKKAIVGSGFMTPPTERPFFGVFPDVPRDNEHLSIVARAEATLLKDINKGLHLIDKEATEVGQMAELYRQVDMVFRTTLEELDHFGAREGARYLGCGKSFAQQLPQWPKKGKFKVFAYLQNFKGLPRLLEELQALKVGVLIYGRDFPDRLVSKYASDYLNFSRKPVDLNAVARQADIAITHCNHDTVLQFLMAGVPQLLIPRHQEQLFLALRLKQLGCALTAFQDQSSFRGELQALMQSDSYSQEASNIGQKYQAFSMDQSNDYIAATMAELLG